ncbi:MAG: O-methyltransferase [Chitinophagales bacterium]|jgi:predicted O-methyltransferase YrrM|nr:class I SAM-dependent methyltransferase [Sphingobacteriales bacterium]
MLIDQLIFRLFSYPKYYWFAQSNHYIHSPFIFQWIGLIQTWANREDETLKAYRNLLAEDSSAFSYNQDKKVSSISVKNRYAQTSIDDVFGKILSATSVYMRSKSFLELGTSLGVSTAYIVTSNHSIVGTTIDSNPLASKIAKDRFDRIFPEHHVKFETGLFKDVLPRIVQDMQSIDFVFIDGDHSYEATLENVQIVKPYLSENSVIVLDDIRWSRSMFRAWSQLVEINEFNYTVDYGRIGLLFKVNNNSPKQHFYLH